LVISSFKYIEYIIRQQLSSLLYTIQHISLLSFLLISLDRSLASFVIFHNNTERLIISLPHKLIQYHRIYLLQRGLDLAQQLSIDLQLPLAIVVQMHNAVGHEGELMGREEVTNGAILQ
jgi:hypothetical protein